MEKSIKELNRPRLLIILVANILLLYAMVENVAVTGGDWLELLNGATSAIPPAIGLIFVGILNAVLTDDDKSRLVFLRWNHPLPGCRAFSHYAAKDDKIDHKALEEKYGPFSTDPHEQNAKWFTLYASIEDRPSVFNFNREFVFARDYASLALMMLVGLGVFGVPQIPPGPARIW